MEPCVTASLAESGAARGASFPCGGGTERHGTLLEGRAEGGAESAAGAEGGEVAEGARDAGEADVAEDAGVRQGAASAPRPLWRRLWAPAALLLAAIAAFFLFRDVLTFDAIAAHQERLLAWRDQNLLGALLAFAGAYVLAVALSIPGALWLTVLGGYLFGVWSGGVVVLFSATLGATLVFLIARSSLGALLEERAGPWLGRLRAGFQRDAASYLLLLRLTPIAPFFVVNLAPAFLGASARLFIWTTFVGIAPMTFVYTSLGASIGMLIEQGERPSLDIVFRPEILAMLLGLAAVIAAPMLLRRRFRRG